MVGRRVRRGDLPFEVQIDRAVSPCDAFGQVKMMTAEELGTEDVDEPTFGWSHRRSAGQR
jgi:hypothetical protein